MGGGTPAPGEAIVMGRWRSERTPNREELRGGDGRRPCRPDRSGGIPLRSSIRTTANRLLPSGDLSSVAIPMFGGVDPGEVDESDAVRAVAARRLAGMGVDTAAAADWLANYSTDWVFPSDADGRRLAYLEDQGIHAEVVFPGPVLAGGLSPAMYLGSATSKNLEPVWPAIHAYNRWLAEFCAAAPGRRAACIPIDLHDMDRAVEEIAWVRSSGIFGGIMLPAMSIKSGLPGYADEYYEPLWSACEDHDMVVNLHTGAFGDAGHRQQVPVRRQARGLPRVVRGLRLHPAPALVHDLRRGVRPPPAAQGGRHGERRTVAALARPRHGGVLRHPWRGAGALLSQAATGGVFPSAIAPRRVPHDKVPRRSRDARRDRDRPPDVGGRLSPPGGGRARAPAHPAPGLRPRDAGRRRSAGCSV